MGDAVPTTYIVGIIIFTFFIVGGVALIGEMRDTNPDFINNQKYDQFNSTFNVLDDVTGEVGTIQDNIANADTDFGLFGVLNSLISSAWQTLRLLFSSFGFMNTVFIGFSTFFGIPAWVSGLIILLVTIMFAGAIFAAIFHREI
jgi:hypothetical protein